MAAGDGNLNRVKYFLDLGIDVNIRDERGSSALHYASQRGQDDVVEELYLFENLTIQH